MSTLVLPTHVFFYVYPQGDKEFFFNISWMRVKMSYHRFNNLAELLNRDLSAKIGWGILSKDLMDR